MDSKKKDYSDSWLSIILGVLAIMAIKSIFENDDSKIVSKKGKKILQDKNKMDEINNRIKEIEKLSSAKKDAIYI